MPAGDHLGIEQKALRHAVVRARRVGGAQRETVDAGAVVVVLAVLANFDFVQQPRFEIRKLQLQEVQEAREDAVFRQIEMLGGRFANVFAKDNALPGPNGERRI